MSARQTLRGFMLATTMFLSRDLGGPAEMPTELHGPKDPDNKPKSDEITPVEAAGSKIVIHNRL